MTKIPQMSHHNKIPHMISGAFSHKPFRRFIHSKKNFMLLQTPNVWGGSWQKSTKFSEQFSFFHLVISWITHTLHTLCVWVFGMPITAAQALIHEEKKKEKKKSRNCRCEQKNRSRIYTMYNIYKMTTTTKRNRMEREK